MRLPPQVSRFFVACHHSHGTEVHAGPAKFEFGDDEFVDWVDGQAVHLLVARVVMLGSGMGRAIAISILFLFIKLIHNR